MLEEQGMPGIPVVPPILQTIASRSRGCDKAEKGRKGCQCGPFVTYIFMAVALLYFLNIIVKHCLLSSQFFGILYFPTNQLVRSRPLLYARTLGTNLYTFTLQLPHTNKISNLTISMATIDAKLQALRRRQAAEYRCYICPPGNPSRSEGTFRTEESWWKHITAAHADVLVNFDTEDALRNFRTTKGELCKIKKPNAQAQTEAPDLNNEQASRDQRYLSTRCNIHQF